MKKSQKISTKKEKNKTKMPQKHLDKVGEKAKNFAAHVKDKIALSIGAAFGLVIALAWNDAIKEGVDKITTALGLVGTAYVYKIIAAVIVTIIAVIGIILISKWAEKKA